MSKTSLVSAIVIGTLLSSCGASLVRSPVPEDQIVDAAPYGIEGPLGFVRIWGDTLEPSSPSRLVKGYAARLKKFHAAELRAGQPIEEITLALSGGGPDGAYGAGLLNGWSARGDRPEFKIVTGISTGAIIAVFAFLGPDYDDDLKQVYTAYETSNLVGRTFFSGVTRGTALFQTDGYREIIEKYVDDDLVQRLAEEHVRGRTLLIGTTNLDALRPVIWSITAIAASGEPNAKRLIQDVIQASSAIPGVFPPVIVPVTTPDGGMFDEMHVDGGATQQVMFFTPEVPLREIEAELGGEIDRTIFIVMNNKLQKPYDPVAPRIFPIAGSSLSSLLGGSGAGDVYKIFAIANRDDMKMQLTWVPKEFDATPDEMFDPDYMNALYDLGYQRGLAGDHWASKPPDYRP